MRGVVRAAGGVEVLVEVIDGLGYDVEFSDVCGAVAEVFELEGEGEGGAGGEGGELVVVVGVAELAIGVVVDSS